MGRGRTGVIGSLAFTALVSLALAACSGDDGKPAPPATTAVVSPAETSPAETSPAATILNPPVRPVDRPTEASAIEFIRYFWDTYNYAFDTLDPSYLEAASDPGCKFCSGTADAVRDIATKDGSVIGGNVELLNAVVQVPDTPQDGTIQAAINRRPSTTSIPDSSPVVEPGYRKVPSEYAVKWQDARWHMGGVVVYIERGQPWSK